MSPRPLMSMEFLLPNQMLITVIHYMKGNVFISACLLPAFSMFNKVLVSVPKCTVDVSIFSTTISNVHFLASCPNKDVAIFSTTVSVMTQCSLFGSLPKWRCCHVLNICISQVTTVFCSVPLWRCFTQDLYSPVKWRYSCTWVLSKLTYCNFAAQNDCEAHYKGIDMICWIYARPHIAHCTLSEMM